jgi:hypothetical protein
MLHHKNVTESKPRFAKHEVEALEAEFQLNHKPNSLTKRGLAEKMGVEVPRINNWFQNRRAKEKHDLKLREYEKQQREDRRDVVDPSSSAGRSAEPGPKDSAGEAQKLAHPEPQTTISTAVMGGDDGDADVTEPPSPPDQSVLQSSEDVSEQLSSTESSPLPQELDLTPASELDGFHFGPTFSNSTSSTSFEGQEQVDLSSQDGLTAEENMFSTPFSDNSEFQALPTASYIHYNVPTFPSESFLDVTTPMPINTNANSEQYGGIYPFRSHATSTMPMSQSPPPPPAELCFKPHRSIAERRKRQRPTELGDFSKLSRSQGPRTGIEMGRRLEHPAPMRRTASATGMYPVGISKASTASSYNLKQESLLLGLRTTGSPTLTEFNNAVPPMSPRVRELTPAMSASSEDHSGHYYVKSEPYAMHTPPKTPGLHLNLPPPSFSITADGFGNGLDDSLLTPGLMRDSSELEFPGCSNYHPIPRYAASQPVTPGFAPHNFGPSYMWGAQPTNHASEYRFPDSSACYVDSSARSSPGGQHLAAPVSFQFAQNITPQDFRVEL